MNRAQAWPDSGELKLAANRLLLLAAGVACIVAADWFLAAQDWHADREHNISASKATVRERKSVVGCNRLAQHKKSRGKAHRLAPTFLRSKYLSHPPVIKPAPLFQQHRILRRRSAHTPLPYRTISFRAATGAPNRVVTTGTGGAPSTLEIRRRITNTTTTTMTRLRFRLVDFTTDGTPVSGGGPQAVLRAVSSASITINGQTTVPLTLEEAPNQPNGGGLNSSLLVGTPAAPVAIAPGNSVTVNIKANFTQGGQFRYLILIEVSP